MKVQSCVQLRTTGTDEGHLHVVIETPQGTRNKFKYDEELGLFRLHHVLPLGISFPYDFGFVPSTRAEDGDPLDVLVLLEEPAGPGCIVTVRPLGVIEAEETEDGKTVRNDRLLAVLDTEKTPATFESLDELGEERLKEIENFFVSYNRLYGKEFKPLRRRGPRHAWRLVKEAARRYKKEG